MEGGVDLSAVDLLEELYAPPAPIQVGAFSTTAGVGDYAAGEGHYLSLPRLWRPNSQARRGALYFHGATQTAYAATGSPSYSAMPISGYPHLAIDAGGTTAWGNDTAIARATDGWTYLKGAKIGVKTDKVLLIGGSMGGLTALNWARQNKAVILGVYVIIPVLDLNNVYTTNTNFLTGTSGPTYQGSIGTAYGVAYPTALPGLATHSPVAYVAADLSGLPIKIMASDNDPIASTTAQCQSWAATINAAGGNVTVGSLGAVGHSFTNVDGWDVVRFFDSLGGRN